MPGGRVAGALRLSGAGDGFVGGNHSETGGPAGIFVGRFLAGRTKADCGAD